MTYFVLILGMVVSSVRWRMDEWREITIDSSRPLATLVSSTCSPDLHQAGSGQERRRPATRSPRPDPTESAVSLSLSLLLSPHLGADSQG